MGRAEDLTCYSIQSEDIWGWHVKVKQALASADGKSVSLYTEPLYQGTYTIKLNKMTSAMTAANVSDSGTVYRFTVEDWPKDRAFYLARFRLPVIILGGLLVVLAAAALLRGRKERTEEKLAEAEHLLTDAAPVQQSLPRRWITLYLSTRRGIAETRWSAYVESSLIIGSDATQCDLCLADGRTAPARSAGSGKQRRDPAPAGGSRRDGERRPHRRRIPPAKRRYHKNWPHHPAACAVNAPEGGK